MRVGLTEEEKIEHALALNFVRRHLTREQRCELVIKLRQQGWSFPKIAEVLGVDEKTVRRDHSISAFAEIEHPLVIQRADGKRYPARQRTAGLMAGRSRAPGAGHASCASALLKKKRSSTRWRSTLCAGT